MTPCGALGAEAAFPARALTAPDGLPASIVLDAASAASRTDAFAPRQLFLELDGVLLFSQDDGVYGTELWRTDGTPLGTYRVLDICPGRCSGVFDLGLHSGAVANGLAFFAADDGVHGIELWASDGTAAGTRLVRDLAPGRAASQPRSILAAGGQVAFAADDGSHGEEIWGSDGTPLGTRLLFDSIPGPETQHMAPFGYCGVLYAAGTSGLWRIDGPPGGGVLLTDAGIQPTESLENLHLAYLPDCRMVFAATDAAGTEPWVSDGTPAGTFRIADLSPGGGSSPFPILRMGASVVFLADSPNTPSGVASIWTTDGTLGGVSEFLPPPGLHPSRLPGTHTVAAGKLFLGVYEPSQGLEPGVWDGFSLTIPVDVNPGTESALVAGGPPDFSWNGSWFVPLGDSVLFPATHPDHGLELWRSDGTAGGTERLTEVGPGTASAAFDPFTLFVRPTVFQDRLYFRTWNPATGHRLWSSDGSVGGSVPLLPLNDQTPAFFPLADIGFPFESSGSACVAATASRVVFETEVDARATRRIYGSDGTPPGTELLLEEAGWESFTPDASCTPFGGGVLFVGSSASSADLFRTGGTAATTATLATIFAASGGRYYVITKPPFVVSGPNAIGLTADQIVRTDGTPGGTNVEDYTLEFYPVGAAPVPGGALFGAFDLLVSDGTAAGTSGIGPPDSDYPEELEPCLGGALFFQETAAEGRELWWSDGTAPGTHLVADIVPGPDSSESDDAGWEDFGLYRDIACLGERAVFVADDGAHGAELWGTDGTAGGTSLLADLYFGSYPSRPRRLTRVGDRAFFAAETDLDGLELWVTDGTPEGTHLVRDLVPGAESSVPQALTAYKNLLLFSAWTPQFGREAWRSDGTPEGTVRITDLAPGPESSSPDRFAVVGDRLFFAANDLVHGFELFTLVDPELARIFRDGFESGDASRWELVAP